MSTVHIGSRKVLLSGNWLVPEGESVKAVFEDHEGDEVKMAFEFTTELVESDSGDKKKPTIQITDANGGPLIRFVNWRSSLGSHVNAPLVFAKAAGGVELSLLASVSKLGKMYRAEIQIMLEIVK